MFREAALAVLLVAAGGVPAHAQDPATGFLCAFSSIEHENHPGTHVGEVDGGPVTPADLGLANDPTAEISITCTIQVGANVRYSDPDAASASSLVAPGAAVLPPTPVTYQAGEGDTHQVCTEVTVGGVAYYYDYDWLRWSTSPDARCDVPITFPVDPPPGPVETVQEILHLVLCPILAVVLPPYGDVPGVLDCPGGTAA